MAIRAKPFPSRDCSDGSSCGWLETRNDFERLLSACGDEFVAQHAPEMELNEDSRHELDRWEFPLGTPLDKLRPRVIELWPLMPERGKRLFLLAQCGGAMMYLEECMESYENAGFDLPGPLEELSDQLADANHALTPEYGELLGYPADMLESFRPKTGQPAAPGRPGRSRLQKDDMEPT